MANCSAIYGWQGGTSPKQKKPECSRATHANLIEKSGKMMADARRAAYATYAHECRAWGREPMSSTEWFKYANAACMRCLKTVPVRTVEIPV